MSLLIDWLLKEYASLYTIWDFHHHYSLKYICRSPIPLSNHLSAIVWMYELRSAQNDNDYKTNRTDWKTIDLFDYWQTSDLGKGP